MAENSEVVVLCSGGLDSVTAAHLMRKRNPSSELTLLFFDYGQCSTKREKKCVKACARKLKGEFVEVKFPGLKEISPLSRRKKSRGKQTGRSLADTSQEHVQWYVPFRNTIFLSYAFALAESIALKERNKKFLIVTGFKCEGKEPYPDTTAEYVKVINALAKTAAPLLALRVEAPLITMDKEEIIVLGERLGMDFAQTWSCYMGGERHCGECLACRLRKAGFYWANVEDPAAYLK